jgi:hypothetical protein
MIFLRFQSAAACFCRGCGICSVEEIRKKEGACGKKIQKLEFVPAVALPICYGNIISRRTCAQGIILVCAPHEEGTCRRVRPDLRFLPRTARNILNILSQSSSGLILSRIFARERLRELRSCAIFSASSSVFEVI